MFSAVNIFAGTINPPDGPCGQPCCWPVITYSPDGTIKHQTNLYRCRLKTMHCSVKCFGTCGYVSEATNPCPGESSTAFSCGDYACTVQQVCNYDVSNGLFGSVNCTSASVETCSVYAFTVGCNSSARTACESLGYSTCGSVYTVDCAIIGGAGN